ncbi:hypothetical protein Aglo03_21300 [Actinokineospora globicatena]|uniref:Uncharacterized protein n=1 Tax=Actinokineospora globicatena TaxID=103729 RepID=A0A9W6QMP1_9PSEU|nr:hypothetical protein Aglo03_21300 [Actinokineospora globicatena]
MVALAVTMATTNDPNATTFAASHASITRLRSHRSTRAPAGNPTTNWATASAASTSPDAAADPVSANTSSGNAIIDALNPTSAQACPTHSNV